MGIGGFCKNGAGKESDRTWQLGAEPDVSASGQTQSYPWHEMLPQAPVSILLAIAAGHRVTAGLSDGPSTRAGTRRGAKGGSTAQTWTLLMGCQGQGQPKLEPILFSYASSLASAERIGEAPISGASVVPLAGYARATFDSGSAKGVAPA